MNTSTCSKSWLFVGWFSLSTQNINTECQNNFQNRGHLLAIIVAYQEHGMQTMLRGLWVAWVRCGDEPSGQWTEELRRELQPKDNGMPGTKGLAHEIQVHRDLS